MGARINGGALARLGARLITLRPPSRLADIPLAEIALAQLIAAPITARRPSLERDTPRVARLGAYRRTPMALGARAVAKPLVRAWAARKPRARTAAPTPPVEELA